MVALLESAQGSALALLILAPFLLGMAGSVLLHPIGYLAPESCRSGSPSSSGLPRPRLRAVPHRPGRPALAFLAASLGLAMTVAKRTERRWWTGRPTNEATS